MLLHSLRTVSFMSDIFVRPHLTYRVPFVKPRPWSDLDLPSSNLLFLQLPGFYTFPSPSSRSIFNFELRLRLRTPRWHANLDFLLTISFDSFPLWSYSSFSGSTSPSGNPTTCIILFFPTCRVLEFISPFQRLPGTPQP